MKFLNKIDGADKLIQDSNNRLVTDAEKTAWNGKQNALGYTPVNKAGDIMTGDLKVNGDIVAGKELVVGYNGTTESLQRHKWKYNGSTGYLELWRYSRQNKWELSATFPNRSTGDGGLVVEGKQMATEDYVNNKVKTDVPANAKFTDTVYSHPPTHPASMIIESTTKRFVSDAEKANWNSKGVVNLGTFSSQEALITHVVMNQLPTGQYSFILDDYPYLILLREKEYQYNGVYQDSEGMHVLFQVTKTGEIIFFSSKNFFYEIGDLWDFKVDKEEGKGLSTNDYTTEEKNKLTEIEAGANKYTHPTNHPASMITESATKRFVSDTEKSTWNSNKITVGKTQPNSGWWFEEID